MTNKGLTYIFTGNGKGKTTAAVGMSIRALSQGLSVCYIHFHKDPEKWGEGELAILKQHGAKVYGFAKQCPVFDKDLDKEQVRKECLEAIEQIRKEFEKDNHDLMVLDEINNSLACGFLQEQEIIDLIQTKPEQLNLVLTGRGASQGLIDVADLVSNIQDVKHPFEKGDSARKGLEY